MIKRRIPEQYDLESIDLMGLIRTHCPDAMITVSGDRIIRISNATTEQLQALKTEFLATVETVSDL